MVAVALFATGCRGNNELPSPAALQFAGAQRNHGSSSSAGKIQHVVIVIQENRSFNNLFYGYPGAMTTAYGYDSKNRKIALQPITLATKWDMQHNGVGFINSCNGKGKIPGTRCRMNGFDKETCNAVRARCPHGKDLAYSYVPHSETAPYFAMAQQYVLADQMYASDFDTSSFESHQYIIAGVNPENSVEYPRGTWGCSPDRSDRIYILKKGRKWGRGTERPCWDPMTLGDELDAATLANKCACSWAFYAVALSRGGSGSCPAESGGGGIWSAYQAIKHICYAIGNNDWATDVQPFARPAQFLHDVAQGQLRAVTWVTPTFENSDHGGSGSATGPSWVASVVNAVGESPFWSSTAIFIFWDDSGGWYDPEPPAYLRSSNYDGLGYRLPLLIISPYAKKGVVSHTHYEHGSILKFVEETFGLAPLAASDRRANSPIDAFDFTQAPRPFVPIQAPYSANYFMREPVNMQPPDTD
jgi:phospholipase C